ncbi:uncharacterized protein LOC127103912 [Lathyrus oleraceus]|uniref:uncharacterized protein LOC127103912 n=1 Tax=Pisum sativum TaxID=3888 RepID=UPI0021CF7DF6|nr:uncharacterized protein LOC127103912 [Pisum sativum]
MSQPSVSTHSKRTKEQSNPKSNYTDMDLSEVITDVVPLFMVPGHATSIRKPRTTTSRKGKPFKRHVDKNIHVLIFQVLGIEPKTGVVSDVSTSLAQPDNPTETPLDKFDENVSTQSLEKSEEKDGSDGMSGDLSDKEENSIEKKDQSTDIVNVDDLDSDDEPIGKRLDLGIAKRLNNRKDIVSATRKQAYGKKIPTNIPEVLIDNISFHSVENVEKWKFIYQRRLVLEREIGKVAFEGKEECDNNRSTKFRKVYVRGRCVDFSPEIINRFLGRNEEEQDEVKVSDNVIFREITAKSFVGKHVPDIVMTSGQKPTSSTTKTGILAELKDTCKTLDDTIKVCIDRKGRLEILIKDLFEEGAKGNLEGDNVDAEDAKSANTSNDEETSSSDED